MFMVFHQYTHITISFLSSEWSYLQFSFMQASDITDKCIYWLFYICTTILWMPGAIIITFLRDGFAIYSKAVLPSGLAAQSDFLSIWNKTLKLWSLDKIYIPSIGLFFFYKHCSLIKVSSAETNLKTPIANCILYTKSV